MHLITCLLKLLSLGVVFLPIDALRIFTPIAGPRRVEGTTPESPIHIHAGPLLLQHQRLLLQQQVQSSLSPRLSRVLHVLEHARPRINFLRQKVFFKIVTIQLFREGRFSP